MNRRLVSALAIIPAAVLTLSACEFEGTATGNGSVTQPTTSAPVGVPGPDPTGTVTPDPTEYPTGTETPDPTDTVEPTTPPVTTTPVGVPGPDDPDFVEYDCADFPLEGENGELISAQTVFDSNGFDIHGLDADGDGTACEDTDPAAVATDDVPDSPDEAPEDAADVAVSPDAAEFGITVDVQNLN